MIDVKKSSKSDEADNRIHVAISSQVSLLITGKEVFRELQKRVLKWAFDPEKNLRGIPEQAWKGESFEIDADHSERAAAIKLNEGYWAFRMSERLKDSNRIWTTEVGIAAKTDSEALFGCRLLCSQRGTAEAIPRSIPKFVRGIVFTQESFLDGRPVTAEPWLVNDQASVDELVKFLNWPGREHPVVVFATEEHSDDPDSTIVPVRGFMRRTAGYVHTVVVTGAASYLLTDAVGKSRSVFQQAVRTYSPGFGLGSSGPSDHPLATAATIENWEEGRSESFEDFLVQQSLRLQRPRKVLEEQHPPFHHIKVLAAQQARKKAKEIGRSDAELEELYQEEVEAAKQQMEESLNLAETAENDKQQAIADLRETKASFMALQARLEALQKKQLGTEVSTPIPDSLSGIEDWAEKNLSGEVVLHDRAIKAARSSGFQDADLVYRILLLLRDYYVPMRKIGGAELKSNFEEQLAQLHLENTKCFTQENRAKSFGGEYFVTFQGERRELDWHLKGSNARDGQRGLRLYYFWDEETSQVVVGYFPGHLRNDLT